MRKYANPGSLSLYYLIQGHNQNGGWWGAWAPSEAQSSWRAAILSPGQPVLNEKIKCYHLLYSYSTQVLFLINPRPTKGGGYHPPYGLSPAAQKRKRKWPRASKTSLLHPLRSCWWKKKKPGVPPEDGGRVSRQSSKVRGVVATSKYLKSPFWKRGVVTTPPPW